MNKGKLNRKARRYHQSVVSKIVNRSPHLTPEEVATAAARVINGNTRITHA